MRPAERVGVERDAERLAALPEVSLQADGEIKVFADRGPVVAADGDDGVAAEHAKCSRDEHHGVLRRAGEPEQQETAHVLDDLEPREPAARQRHVGDAAVLDATAVGDPDI